MPLRIHVSAVVPYPEVVKYTLRTIFFNKRSECVFVADKASADITVGVAKDNDIRVSPAFYGDMTSLDNNLQISLEDGSIDYLGNIFYHINSLQEHNTKNLDEYGRFRFDKSIQHYLNNADTNVVQQLIDELIGSQPKLSSLIGKNRKSKFFLTHDIDSVHGAIKEDGFYALKNIQFAEMFRLLFNAAFAKPDWLNMDKIINIEDEYGFKSTFYWLLIKDKQNSDYNFASAKIQKEFKCVADKGWENGLHKSMGQNSFADEIKIFGSKPKGNRFHYLKFELPKGYDIIEASGIPLDTSLGFSEALGFRNSYGLPFMPYNLQTKKTYNFVEVPQLIMDRTFFKDRKGINEIKRNLIDFFEMNKHDCVFTINWHNNFFTELKYAGYVELYRTLLEYFKESQIECITQSEIIKEYYKPEIYQG